jgi:hypothetical protein
MEKNILNEIDGMKYLLGYKRGVVISEQTTISGNELENLPDETPVANTGTAAPAANTGTATTDAKTGTAAPAANTGTETPVANTGTASTDVKTGTATTDTKTGTETPNPTVKMGVFNPRVQLLQQLMNNKFKSGLDDDGKYGPKTAAAILKNIEAIKQMKLNPVSTLGNEVKTVVQQPGQQITSNTNLQQQTK